MDKGSVKGARDWISGNPGMSLETLQSAVVSLSYEVENQKAADNHSYAEELLRVIDVIKKECRLAARDATRHGHLESEAVAAGATQGRKIRAPKSHNVVRADIADLLDATSLTAASTDLSKVERAKAIEWLVKKGIMRKTKY